MATINQTFDGFVGTSGNPVTIGGYTYALRSSTGASIGTLAVENEFNDAVLDLSTTAVGYLSIAQASGGVFDLDALTIDRDISLFGNTLFVGYRNGVQVASADFGNILGVGDQRIQLGSAFDSVTEVRVYSRSLANVNLGVGFAIDDVVTNDTTAPAAPTLSAGTAATADNTPTLTGTAEIGSTVRIFSNGTLVGTTTAGATGAYSFTPTVALADGTYSLTATATDASGNASAASAAISLRIDATAPPAPVFTAGGGLTNDNTPTVSGTAEANATVSVFNGTTLVGTTTANASGAWSVTSGTLGDGSYNLTATARDGLGNTSVTSAPLGLRIDTAAPGAPTVTAPSLTNSPTPTVTGTAEAGSTVTLYNGTTVIGTGTAAANGTYTITPTSPLPAGNASLTATATDAAGNVSGRSSGTSVTVDLTAPTAPTLSAGTAATADNTPTLTGTAEAGATVTILSNGAAIGTTTAGANGAYSFTPTVALADGTYTLTATARDAAGNLGPASGAISLRVDATAPGTPVFLSGGGLTNDSTPTVTGTAEAGATVTISNGGTVLGTAIAGSNGVFTFTPETPLTEGAYNLTAVARDAVGNASPASAALSLQLDLTAPRVPTIAPLAPTNDSTPTITGTAEAGSVVTISNGATILGSTTAAANGTFSFTPGTALPDGTASLTATARDAAGNLSGPSTAVSVTIDTLGPAAPALDPLAPTSDTTPTITGTAEAGATVTISSGTTVLGTATADANGTFTFTPTTPLTDGTRSLTATARDPAGNLSPASQAVSLTIDTAAPAAPALASIPLTSDSTPTISGTAEPGATVTISDGTTVLGTVTAAPNGTFSFTPANPLTDGTTSLTATARDAAGNLSPVSATASVTVDTAAPAAPVIAPLGPTNDTTPTITGTAEAGTTVTILNNGAVIGTATAGPGGTFSFTPGTALAAGTANLTATARDAAGNLSPVSATVGVTIDTTAPTAPALDPLAPTSDTTPTITGTAEAGTTVTILSNGAAIGTATAGANGTFSFTPTTPLTDGTRSLTATARDPAGNLSPASQAVSLTIDTAAPAAPALASIPLTSDSTPTISGTAEPGATVTISDGTTVLGTVTAAPNGTFSFTPANPLTDGTTSLTATARDAAGNLSPVSATASVTVDTAAPAAPVITPLGPTNDTTPTITGTAEAGATVTILNNGAVIGTATAGPGGTFTFTPGTALAAGTANLTATARDAAGNLSPVSATVGVTIDTTAPTAPALDPLAPTSDTTPTITGTAEAGTTVTILSNGAAIGTATAGPDGGFSFTPTTPLATGTAQITATALDLAGNVSPASQAVSLTIDTAAPGAPVITPLGPTSDSTPTISGTAEAGATVTVTSGGAVIGTAVADAQGTFSVTPTTALADGTAPLVATARDAAGNLSAPSTPVPLTVDTVAPGTPAINAIPPTNDATPTITGRAEAGASVTVTSGGLVLGTVTADANGNFTIEPEVPLPNGTSPLVATARDAAGNLSAASPTVTVTVDTRVPGAPIVNYLAPTNDDTPVITGTAAAAGDLVTISLNGAEIGRGTAGPGGVFNITVTELPEGASTLAVVARGSTGNVSPTATLAVLVDTIAPDAPALVAFSAPTNDASPIIRGTAEAGATVTISIGTNPIGTAVADANGTFSFTPATDLPQGPTSLTATARDVAGNVSAASAPITVQVDLTPPGQPTIDPIAPTNDTTPTITGTAEIGSTVTLTAGGLVLGSAVADANGVYTITPSTPLQTGSVSITATAQDGAGNVSVASAPVTAIIDTAPPPVPTITNTPGPIADNTPTITGTAEANALVAISSNGAPIGTVTADGNGNFSFTPAALGDGSYTFTATAWDAAGNASGASAAVTLGIDTTAPGAPVITTAAGPTTDSTPTITGTAEANAVVTISSNGTSVGTVTADGNGNFSFTSAALGDGSYTFTATARDAAGNTGPASAAVGLIVDTGVPLAPSLAPVAGPTNDNTPTLTGTAEPNAVVTISNNGAPIGTVTADGTGNFTFTPAALGDGSYSLTATATDAAGQVSPASDAVSFVVDTAAPGVPTLTSPGGPTASATPAITGNGELGATVTLFDGTNAVGTATVGPNGTFSVSPTNPLGQGTHSLTVQLTDAAGNVGAASAPLNVVVDTLPPAAPVITTAAGPTNDSTPTITGTAEANALVTISSNGASVGTVTADGNGNFSFTSAALGDGSYSFTATARDAAGNTGPASTALGLTVDTAAPAAPSLAPVPGPTNDNTPTLTGTAAPNAVVTISNNGAPIGTVTADGTGNFSFTPAALGDGSYSLTATARDAAGNTGVASAPVSFVVDTAAPDVPTLTSPGGPTASATPAITGNGEVGATVTLFDGTNAVGTATVGPNGTFSVSPTSPLGQGTHSLSVQLTDAAGNVGAASAPLNVVVDTLPPAAPVITTAAGPTGDSTPTITGTAEAGAMITVSNASGALGTTMADGNGAWSFTPGSALPDGSYTFTATARDAAGNTGPASAALGLTVDTGVPLAPSLAPVAGPTNDNTPTLTGTAEPNAVVTISNNGTPLGTVTADGTGNFTFTPATLGDGSYSLTATARDAAGNTGVASAPVSFVVDTAAPGVPTLTSPGGPTASTTPAITGNGEAGATVTLLDGTNAIGTATVGPNGTFSVSPTSPLAEGAHSLTVQLTDAAGNVGAASAPLNVVVDTAIDTGTPAALSVNTTADGVLNAAEAAVTGFTVVGLDPGTSGTALFTDGTRTVSVAVGADGTYSANLSALNGAVTSSLVLADTAGNGATITGPTLSLDTVAPAGTAAASAAGGPAATSFTVTVTFPETVTGLGAEDFVLSGTGDSAGTISAVAGSGGSYTVTVANVTGSGTLTLSLAPGSDIADAAGNLASLIPASRAVDVPVPGEPARTVITGFGEDSGLVGDGITNDPAPVLTGTGIAGGTVSVSYTDAAGPHTLTGAIDPQGNWSLALPSLADGGYSFTASATGPNGETGRASAPLALTIDTTADAAPTVTLVVAEPASGALTPQEAAAAAFTLAGLDAGSTATVTFTDGIRSVDAVAQANGTYTVDLSSFSGTVTSTVVITDVAGNRATGSGNAVDVDQGGAQPSDLVTPLIAGIDADTGTPGDAITSDTSPSVTGLGTPGTTVVLRYTDAAGPHDLTVPVASDGSWRVDLPTLPDGTYDVVATGRDAAGNVSAPSQPLRVVIDTVADAGAPVALAVAPPADSVAGAAEAANTAFTVSGLDPDATAAVTFTDGTRSVTVQAGADGRYTADLSSLNGTVTSSLVSTDAAGNVATASGQPIAIDSVAPAAPTVDGTSGGTSADPSPVFTGSAEPGSTVTVTYGTPQGPATVTGTTGSDGRWSVEVPPLPDGTYTFTVDATDAQGNRGASGAPVVLTIDAVPDPANIPPTGVVDSARTTAHALAIAGNVLANDQDVNTGDVLRVAAVQFAGGLGHAVTGDGSVEVVGNFGTLRLAADGSYSYQAIGANSLNAGATAVESFYYTVSDGHGGFAQTRLDVTVVGEVPRAEQSFGFAFTDAKVSLDGEKLVLVGPDGIVHDVTGIDTLRFSDGTIQNNDNYRVVDDIYYYAKNLDVWRAHVDADDHFATFGWKEGRDPNAYFHTAEYLAENPDVAAAGVNPLSHYLAYGEREGRSPSEGFSAESYLKQNGDVAQANLNALAHYFAYGQDEGRSVLAGEGPGNVTGDFDPGYYLANNRDVAAATPAGREAESWALQHYLTYGAGEGRDPSAFFDTTYYLAQNPDVAAAGINPLIHYQEFGWREGRNPSEAFDTNAYLAQNPDVAQAQIDPLEHYLQYGIHEGRLLT